MTSEFLPEIHFRTIRLGTEPHTIGAQLAFGHGDAPLEIVVVRLEAPPSKQQLKSWWKHRKAARPAPLLLVALAQEAASVCGPAGEEPPIYTDLDVGVLAALCREALDQPDRHAALRALRDALPAALSPVIGIRNEGLLATHELQAGARLRLAECEENTPRVVGPSLSDGVYQAWERARRSIHESWMAETDPAHLQPKIRKLNREAADFLRLHPPRDMDQEKLDRLIEALESPWSRREENTLRLVWRQEYASAEAKAQALVREIERLGVEPFESAPPLPAIGPEEIHLVCWMGIEP